MFKPRLKIITCLIYLSFLTVVSRLFYWQIVASSSLKIEAVSQTYKIDKILPQRGKIYASDLFPLALNSPSYQLSFYKPEIKTDASTITTLISTIKPTIDPKELEKLSKFLADPSLKWLTLPTSFSLPEISQINLDGLTSQKTPNRFYPENWLFHHLTGSVKNTQNLLLLGINGLESYYQHYLAGRIGFAWINQDAVGQVNLSKKSWYLEPHNGSNLLTFLHRQLQYYAQKELENGVNLSAAQSGLITIINPETGSVLAMAATDDTFTPNPAISSLFEPGSIFKPLTLAMALDSQSIRPDYLCHLCHQPLVVNGHPINNWDNSFHPHSTIQDIIKNSDNIGISLISRQLGRDRFLAYFNRLHLASKTNIDLPQETKPLKKTFWSAVDLATASFGQGFALTQLQFLVAFNTLANQGYLVSPKIVQAIQSGNSTSPIKSPPSIQVFQANTTNQIKSILKYVVENGAVSRYKPANLEVCGKSGTAQVAINGIYTDTVTTASYVGFSPCHKPKFTMIVTLNGPKSSPWGSTTAAPIWFNLAKLANQIL